MFNMIRHYLIQKQLSLPTATAGLLLPRHLIDYLPDCPPMKDIRHRIAQTSRPVANIPNRIAQTSRPVANIPISFSISLSHITLNRLINANRNYL